jgi:nucleoid-associated protein YgaU
LVISDLNGDSIGDFIYSGNNRVSVAMTKNVFKIAAEAKLAADKAAADKAAADKAAADKAAADKAAADKAAAEKAAAEKAAAEKAAVKPKVMVREKTLTCIKGKSSLRVIGKNPKCPTGYKVKK